MANHVTTALIILDGWGENPDPEGNAILQANTPNWDRLLKHNPHISLSASGQDVGLPPGQMGNSEVGHLTIGGGRVMLQDLVKINQAIADHSFFENPIFIEALKQTESNGAALHILGLLSPGGVHSHENHIFALLKLASRFELKKIYIHAFLDGRDTKPKCALESLEALTQFLEPANVSLASISGRFYAMDRDNRWERTQKMWDVLYNQVEYSQQTFDSVIHDAYQSGITDEFIEPTLLIKQYEGIQSNDTVAFMNFRRDRARQLSHAINHNGFRGFTRKDWNKPRNFISLTAYDPKLDAQVAYPTQSPQNFLGEVLSKHHLSQLRLAETEKYAHVTYFFNGGRNEPFPGESRTLIPSLKVRTYDLNPQMSAPLIAEALVQAFKEQKNNLIICNFANADMVGHTGNLKATIKAVEILDECLGKIVTACNDYSAQLFITADHGNADCMYQAGTQNPHTAHTTNLVPFVYLGSPQYLFCKPKGSLADIAPTILNILGIDIPAEMTGTPLLKKGK